MKKKVLMILSIFSLIFSFIAPLPSAAFDDSFDAGSAGWETWLVNGNNYFVSKDPYSWNPNGDTDWTTHTIAVKENNLYRWQDGDSGTKTFAEVAAEGQWVGLFFLDGSSDGISSADGAAVYLDNISAVPTPEAILLIASAFLGLIGINRKIGT